MAELEERLDGHDEIRKYIDPEMSRSYYFKNVRPRLEAVLFKRGYTVRKKGNQTKYFSFKNLIQLFLIRTKEI